MTGAGTISDQNVASNKAVTIDTITLADNTASASNYSLSSATFNVTQRPLNISATKSYDGNTSIASGSDHPRPEFVISTLALADDPEPKIVYKEKI